MDVVVAARLSPFTVLVVCQKRLQGFLRRDMSMSESTPFVHRLIPHLLAGTGEHVSGDAWKGTVKIHERRDSPPSVMSMNTIGSPSPGRGTGGN